MKLSGPVIAGIVIFILILITIPLGIYLLTQQQSVQQQASTPKGKITVRLSPDNLSLPIGEPKTVNIILNTAGLPISGAAIRIFYEYSGTTPNVEAGNIQIAPSIQTNSDWTCPVKTVTPVAGTVNIDITCINKSTSGFISNLDIQLASFTLTAKSIPQINPVTLQFDAERSVVTKKSTGEDTLLTPESIGTYTVVDSGINLDEPSPTSLPQNPANNPTSPPSYPTSVPTVQPANPTSPPPPTKIPSTLPKSAHITPTIAGLLAGTVLLILGLFPIL